MNETRQGANRPQGLAQARVDFRLPLSIEGDDIHGVPYGRQIQASNVTRRGAFLETKLDLAPGALIALYGSEEERILLGYAQVVWVRENPDEGIGVKLVGDNSRWMDYLIAHSVQVTDR